MSNKAIETLYTNFGTRLSNKTWNSYSHILPEAIQEKMSRYKRWQDRQAGLFGKLLLLECLNKHGYPSNCLNNILFDQYGRPYLDDNIDFNISHSGEYVTCSITDIGKVGIDIERIKPIDLSDFEQYMTSKQWENINEAANVSKIFYDYWTIKESVLKADGRGLSIPISEINTAGNKAILHESIWFLRQIDINSDYSCHLATNIENPEIHISEIKFPE